MCVCVRERDTRNTTHTNIHTLIQFDDIYQFDVSIYEEEDFCESVTYQWY